MFWVEQYVWVEIALLPEFRVIFLLFFQLGLDHLHAFLDFLSLFLGKIIPLLLEVVSIFGHF